MKKNSVLTIIAMVILATTVAFVSCKKDSENAPNRKDYTVRQATDIRQLEDPAAYILDFKKNLTESKSDEAYGLEDAAWHLACLANLEFCNVNVKLDDFLFDTVEMKVNVSDGTVLTGDLREAYERMCAEIVQFKKGFSHTDQNLYYINLSINANGDARIALMSSYKSDSRYLYNHTWYFSDEFSALIACDGFFSTDSTYLWNGLAATELRRILDLYEYHEYVIPLPDGTEQMVYFPTRNHTFSYLNDHDPYGSPFLFNSRVFAIEGDAGSSSNYILSQDEMCYCLDSYLGLGYGFIADNLYQYEHPMCWQIKCYHFLPSQYKWWRSRHDLYVEYGQLITPTPPGPSNE